MAASTLGTCLVFVALCIWMAGGLRCFQCMDPSDGGPCQHNYEGLVNTTRGSLLNDSFPYYKECPDGTRGARNDYCIVEIFIVGGAMKSFIRDCSDGKNFSFTGDVQNAKLAQVTTNNFTTCIYRISANAHICVSMCDTDFCNGPVPPKEEPECNLTDVNATCGAEALFTASGPFGPIVDRLLGRAYLLPFLVAILCVSAFG